MTKITIQMRFLIIFFLLTSICYADTIITTARKKQIAIKDNTWVLERDSFWEGTISNINNVTFVGWNFSRKIPHTQVFINCTNLTFIECNLNNVELQADFTVKGSLTIHQREYEQAGKKYKEIECGDNKTRTYEMITTQVDIVEKDFPNLSPADKNKLRQKFQEENIKDVYTEESQAFVSEVETPDAKKIKAIRIN